MYIPQQMILARVLKRFTIKIEKPAGSEISIESPRSEIAVWIVKFVVDS